MIHTHWLKAFLCALAACCMSLQSQAITRSLTYHGSTLSTSVNNMQSVVRHTSDKTLSSAVDYVITAEEGQTAMSARIDITHDQAVVIFRNIRPSVVVSSWLKYISVNGAQAVDGSNCRVEIYRHGTIVLPYGRSCLPLTVYKEVNLQGASNSQYEVNAYYDRLGDFDNAINSFTLKSVQQPI